MSVTAGTVYKIPLNASGATLLKKPWLIALSIVSLSGCDIMYGVSRQAQLDSVPDPQCLERVIRAAPSVETIRQLPETVPAVALGPKAVDRNYSIFYRGTDVSRVRAILQVSTDQNGSVEMHHSLMGLNEKVPQSFIDATRPVMQHIEAGLMAECGVDNLAERVRETCNSARCAPITGG